MSKKRRSVAWVVSTHVLTTGLAIPAVMGMACVAFIFFLNLRDPLIALYLQATFAVMGYVGGTLYSLSYLRKAADCEVWTRCTTPAIVTFAILNVLACAGNVYIVRDQGPLSIGIVAASYLVGTVAAAMLTAQGFARMAPAAVAADDPPEGGKSVASATGSGARFKRRLIAAGVGFATGFAVGVGIAIYMDRSGMTSQAPWGTRLLTGLVVGGIGALLGLVSGPVKL